MYYSALIGKPTNHSVSHIMYEELARLAKITVPYRHLKIDVEKKDLSQTINAFIQLNFIGINVTLPHKIDIIPFVSSLDRSASDIGAINTISLRGNQSVGFNTDWYGVYKPITESIVSSKIQEIVIFGTGGAARAAIFAAKKLSAKKISVFYKYNPRYDYATEELLGRFANDCNVEFIEYSNIADHIKKSQVIINATSTGMSDNRVKSPFKLSTLDKVDLSGKIFLDAVFNPVDTIMISYFRSRGAITIDGLWMMLYQGIEAFNIWLGKTYKFDKSELKDLHDLLKHEVEDV